jgi:hypothetical protein
VHFEIDALYGREIAVALLERLNLDWMRQETNSVAWAEALVGGAGDLLAYFVEFAAEEGIPRVIAR